MFSKASISFSCSGCGHEAKKSMQWLRANDEFICPACGGTVSLESDQMAVALKQADHSAEMLRQRVRNLVKAILEK